VVLFFTFTIELVILYCSMLKMEQILAEGHVAVPLISTTLDIVKVVVVAVKAPGVHFYLKLFSVADFLGIFSYV